MQFSAENQEWLAVNYKLGRTSASFKMGPSCVRDLFLAGCR